MYNIPISLVVSNGGPKTASTFNRRCRNLNPSSCSGFCSCQAFEPFIGRFDSCLIATYDASDWSRWSFVSCVYTLGSTYSWRVYFAAGTNNTDRERENANWRTAHDMVSLVACNAIFNDCKDEEGYQTGELFVFLVFCHPAKAPCQDLIWQLIDLSSWIMCLLEKLAKECILSSDFTDLESSTDSFSNLGEFNSRSNFAFIQCESCLCRFSKKKFQTINFSRVLASRASYSLGEYSNISGSC